MQSEFQNAMKTRTLLFVSSFLLALVACNKPASDSEIHLQISHEVDGEPLVTDTLCYVNEAGNHYLVNEVQWLISNVMIQDEQGEWHDIGKAFYIDTDITDSQTIHKSAIPVGRYVTLQFVFGLNSDDNQSGYFSNPPESEMFWPDELGGGYHYMKLNGKYLNADSLLAPLAIHLGIGQNDELTSFYDNSFVVSLPIDFTVSEGSDNRLNLIMDIENWFRSPNTYDIFHYGSAIMQNQEAQSLLKENGRDVFSIKNQQDMKSPLKTTVQLFQKAASKPHFMTWKNIKDILADIKNDKDPS